MSSFGPTLLSKVLGLNETQESSLGLVFHYADKAGLPLLDLADLRAVVQHLTSDEGKADLKDLGGLSAATAGVILRELIGFADQGADAFFGEPEFDTADLLRTTADGRGLISLVELPNLAGPARGLLDLPHVAARRPVPRPARGRGHRQAEAGLLLRRGAPALRRRVEGLPDQIAQTVRLIRSKGVGVFFVTQSPTDVPDDVLAQLGSRVQHQLRAHTPNDAKALKATVNTYPKSAYADLGEVLTSLGIGEAVVTVMNERGAPTPVAWTRLRAPESLMGTGRPRRDGRRPSRPRRCTRSTPPRSTASPHARCCRRLEDGAAKAEAEEAARQGRAPKGVVAEADLVLASKSTGRKDDGWSHEVVKSKRPRSSCGPRPARSPAACSGPGADDRPRAALGWRDGMEPDEFYDQRSPPPTTSGGSRWRG